MTSTFSPCAQCREACCRDYVVTVSGLDVYRIGIGLGLRPEQFTVPSAFGDPPEGFRVDQSGQTYRMCLDKQRDNGSAGWCTFWMPFGDGMGRCGIYALRPGVCRTYPATLIDGEVAVRGGILCPDGAWGRDSMLHTDLWRGRVEQQYAELEIDAYVNRRWNHSAFFTTDPHDGYRRYLEWIFSAYAQLTGEGVLEQTVRSRTVLDKLLGALEEMVVPDPDPAAKA